MTIETATLGGGCFWCLEAVYLDVDGVTAVESGYAGGQVRDPSYEQVCSGDTGHAEVVRVSFDTDRISYREILQVFFGIHDPTTPNRQGNDIGTQYRSVIFTHSDAQAATAREMIDELERQRVFDDPIVTEVAPVPQYWPGEGYHQRYFERNPYQGYCMMVVGPKVAKFRKQFKHRLKRA
ncbi:MAG: peptide-methionine (S)-S-oxide reductase MsrA [Burkholderiaceae bacterium]|jgi:peptide-methionine (S)-S-oxide reductase|nr:peptide-methionine (S)-S-oxide reductase MsrA [Burkholderiales bacterium]MCZ8104073.1 peptide-methionine (S)-S-oxide reductase MsrA [Burkholderiales bacterium]MCZ8338278.1 peptide-methionine (S)-S-oxide reductase MsrA [Burkholderiaceae bacterium]